MEALYMSPADAGKRYGLARSTIYQIIELPEAPATLKVGARRLLPIKEYDAFMVSNFEKMQAKLFRERKVNV